MTHPFPHPHKDAPTVTAGEPLSQATSAVILLHGRGATASSMLDFAEVLAGPGVAFVALQAANHSWYPDSFLAPLSRNGLWLESALSRIESLQEELEGHGIPQDRIALLGFSQGACLSLEYAARRGGRFGGVVALSGGLIGRGELAGKSAPHDKTFDYPTGLSRTPVFLGCSDVDFHIPLERVETSASVLEGLGAEVTKRIYPGMGHTVNADEIQHAKAIVADLL